MLPLRPRPASSGWIGLDDGSRVCGGSVPGTSVMSSVQAVLLRWLPGRDRRPADARGGSALGWGMASPASVPSGGDPVAPAADPVAIRAALTPMLVAEFDREWELVLERAKVSKDLAGIRDLLGKWRHIAYGELRDPGSYYRMLAKAEQVQRLSANPDAVSLEEMKALLRQRQGRAE